MIMADDHILQLKNQYSEDDSIRSYEFYEYQPITGTQLNNSLLFNLQNE